jgi:hypothetical protein
MRSDYIVITLKIEILIEKDYKYFKKLKIKFCLINKKQNFV